MTLLNGCDPHDRVQHDRVRLGHWARAEQLPSWSVVTTTVANFVVLFGKFFDPFEIRESQLPRETVAMEFA